MLDSNWLITCALLGYINSTPPPQPHSFNFMGNILSIKEFRIWVVHVPRPCTDHIHTGKVVKIIFYLWKVEILGKEKQNRMLGQFFAKIRDSKSQFQFFSRRNFLLCYHTSCEQEFIKSFRSTTKTGLLSSYLIFVIFFTQAKFLENKIYTEIYTVNCQFTQ